MGSSRNPEIYRCWSDMIRRCTSVSSAAWKDYGGRGITVCDRWRQSFGMFAEDMGPKPSPSHSLDRIDNNAGYSPENCRWATPQEQNLNRRPRGVRYLDDGGVRRAVSFRLTEVERAEIETAALKSGEDFSDFARRILVVAACKEAGMMVGDTGIEPVTSPV